MAAGRGRLRASDDDRDQVIEDLKVAFVQGRLTRDELAERVGQALTSRTFADLAAVVADLPATRPRPKRVRTQVHAPVPAAIPVPAPIPVPAREVTRRRANPRMLTWGLILATIALPTLIAAALVTKSQDLFTVSVMLIMAYVMAARISVINVVVDRLEGDSADQSREQPMPRLALFRRGHLAHLVRWGTNHPAGRHLTPDRLVSPTRPVTPARSVRIHADAARKQHRWPIDRCRSNNLDVPLMLFGHGLQSGATVSRGP
jgi:hypothetical protein